MLKNLIMTLFGVIVVFVVASYVFSSYVFAYEFTGEKPIRAVNDRPIEKMYNVDRPCQSHGDFSHHKGHGHMMY